MYTDFCFYCKPFDTNNNSFGGLSENGVRLSSPTYLTYWWETPGGIAIIHYYTFSYSRGGLNSQAASELRSVQINAESHHSCDIISVIRYFIRKQYRVQEFPMMCKKKNNNGNFLGAIEMFEIRRVLSSHNGETSETH